jgi:cell wall-associated NlpC family hydrolase
MGTQYRWGGKSTLGIDCSGLCQMAYMLNGIIIYRDAKIMEGFPIHEIPFEEVKPCDLLFFPGHVAMYMGNGKYVHSTGKNGSDGVVINSFNPKDSDFREDLYQSLKAVGSIF